MVTASVMVHNVKVNWEMLHLSNKTAKYDMNMMIILSSFTHIDSTHSVMLTEPVKTHRTDAKLAGVNMPLKTYDRVLLSGLASRTINQDRNQQEPSRTPGYKVPP